MDKISLDQYGSTVEWLQTLSLRYVKVACLTHRGGSGGRQGWGVEHRGGGEGGELNTGGKGGELNTAGEGWGVGHRGRGTIIQELPSTLTKNGWNFNVFFFCEWFFISHLFKISSVAFKNLSYSDVVLGSHCKPALKGKQITGDKYY